MVTKKKIEKIPKISKKKFKEKFKEKFQKNLGTMGIEPMTNGLLDQRSTD